MPRFLLLLCLALLWLTPASAAPSARGPYVEACRAASVRSHIGGADRPAHQLDAKRSTNGNIWVFVGDAIACEFRDEPLPHLVSLQTSGCYECNYSLGPDSIDQLNRLLAASPERSCWTVGRNDDWSLCFGDHGDVLAATHSALTAEGRSTGGRYRGTGNQITFEIAPDMFDETWPWDWSKVTCTVGGPAGVMALSACVGSGQHWPEASSASREPLGDLTLIRQ